MSIYGKKAFTGIFTYPDEADTDGDGATDGEEVSGIFGGSNPIDPLQYISTLSGKFLYSGIEQGIYHLILTAYNSDEDPTGLARRISVSNLPAVLFTLPLPPSPSTLRNGTPSQSLVPTKTTEFTPWWLLVRPHYRKESYR